MSKEFTAIEEEREINMFGVTINELEEDYKRAFIKSIYICGILSDAQEVLQWDDKETARKYMIKAKYLISKFGVKTIEEEVGDKS